MVIITDLLSYIFRYCEAASLFQIAARYKHIWERVVAYDFFINSIFCYCGACVYRLLKF